MVSKFWPKIINTSRQQQYQQCQQQPCISIQLLESVLYTHHGHHPVLRGVVEIKFKKPSILSSLRLDFNGRLNYHLDHSNASCQKEFAHRSLPIFPSPPSYSGSHDPSIPLFVQGENDQTRFMFEMPLDTESSSWIPTLQCPEFQVKYQVKAVLEYQQQNDYTKKRKKTETLTSFAQPVIIVQLPTQGNLFSSDNMLASIDSRKHTNRWCQYRVIIDKRFAAMTSTLNLSIRLAPMIRGLKLGLVSMHIVQRFTIKNNTSSQSFSRTIPLSCHYQSTPFPSSMHAGGTLYEGEFQYKIPDTTSSSSSGGCLVPSIETSPIANIKVEHLLLVHLALTFPCLSHDGIVRRAKRVVTFQCDFDLLHPCMAESMSDDFMCLPAYDHPRSIIK